MEKIVREHNFEIDFLLLFLSQSNYNYTYAFEKIKLNNAYI